MGPGIDEEYADALSAIHDMQRALGPHMITPDAATIVRDDTND